MKKEWTIEYDACTDRHVIRGPKGIICEINTVVDRLYGSAADLIRTAPEMLEVLKELLESYGGAHSKYVSRDKVGRVIAKAEGRDYEPEKSPLRDTGAKGSPAK